MNEGKVKGMGKVKSGSGGRSRHGRTLMGKMTSWELKLGRGNEFSDWAEQKRYDLEWNQAVSGTSSLIYSVLYWIFPNCPAFHKGAYTIPEVPNIPMFPVWQNVDQESAKDFAFSQAARNRHHP